MNEIGEDLKAARLGKNLSLDQVQQATKIRIKYLQAIEDGEFVQIPGEIYLRGFLRSFAEAVGLDGKELLQRYSQDSRQPEEPREPVWSLPGWTGRKRAARRSRLLTGLLGIIALLALAWVILARLGFEVPLDLLGGEKPQGTPPAASGPASQSPAGSIEPGSGKTSGTAGTGSQSPAAGPGTGGDKAAAGGGNVPGGAGQPPPAPGDPSSAPDLVLEVDSKELTRYRVRGDRIVFYTLIRKVHANSVDNRSWFKVSADGVDVFEGTLDEGQSATWEAKKELKLRIGYPKVTEFIVNGRSLGIPGGDVRNFEYILKQENSG
ncbi:MAG: helix-turn-helix domain-containing protein [Firmicutes bacterium]|nr:helix-turn-helix domain-containing protein [Bacillota bacterium]